MKADPDGPSDAESGAESGDLIHPDIRRAETLPADLYHEPRHYEIQQERVFARSWQWVPVDRGPGQLKASGHVVPFTLLEGCLDEPLFLSRDAEGTLHCLSNVCTHRGALVVEGEGHHNTLRCRYHGRRFDLDGCFVSMPEFDETEDFPSPEDDLPELPLHRWGPLLFTSLDPPYPFDEWFAPVEERVGWLPLEEFVPDPDRSHDYLVPANWALYVDNYVEEFHIPYVHGGSLTGELDYEAYRTETFAHGNLQLGVGRAGGDGSGSGDGAGSPTFDLPEGHPDEGTPVAAFYFWLFPNFMLNFYPWGLSLNLVRPLGPARTRISFRSYVWREELREVGAGAELHRVEMEDEEVVESVQRGVRSRLYDRGRYSPRREVGAHHFHRLLTRAMGETAPGA